VQLWQLQHASLQSRTHYFRWSLLRGSYFASEISHD
jgi:hypothetical protein